MCFALHSLQAFSPFVGSSRVAWFLAVCLFSLRVSIAQQASSRIYVSFLYTCLSFTAVPILYICLMMSFVRKEFWTLHCCC